LATREPYKDFIRRMYREMKEKQKQREDSTNPLLLRIKSLEDRIDQLEKNRLD